MKKYAQLILFPFLLLVMLSASVFAADKPDVIHHKGTYLDRALHVIVQWQSPNPVVKVRITAGKEAKELVVDEYDNKRNPSGYEGEVTVVVPVESALFQANVPYVVQIEDDLRQRSTLISGWAELPKTQFAGGGGYAHHGGQGDAWGQGHVQSNVSANQGGGAGEIVDKLLGVMERHDVPPSIDTIKVNLLSAQNVSFSNKANDDKGLKEVNIKVFDSGGKEAGTQQLANLGKVWQGTTQTFTLQPGNYRVTMQAVDSTGNTSPEKTAVFTLGTATPPPPNQGALVVAIVPDDTVKIGAQWRITGKEWANAGVKADLPPGKYKIEYKEVVGWTTPQVQEVEVIAGQNAQLTGTYTAVAAKKGTIQVAVIPVVVASTGVQWRLDGGAWQTSGAKIEAAEGKHKVEFSDLAGWEKPLAFMVDVFASKDATASGAYGRVYTVNKDFEEGTLVGLEDKTTKDQLQLSKTSTTLPFIWVPNSNEGSISKINTTTGIELGRYKVGPSNANPSRTTVDLQGNCWVGNRGIGTVVKVGLFENGQCSDRNGNGKIDTSTNATALAWGEDECVLFEVVLADNGMTNSPGKGSPVYNGSTPRGVAIDAKNNVWASIFSGSRLYYLDGVTGKIIDKVDTSSVNHTSYGLVVDKSGKVWSSGSGTNNVLRYNPHDRSIKSFPTRHLVYGLGIDKNNHLFAAGLNYNRMTRINTVTEQVELDGVSVGRSPRSIAVTDDGSVWVTNYQYGSITRLNSDLQSPVVIQDKGELTGVAVDSNGKIWGVDYNSRLIRIDPLTNKVEKEFPIQGNHYSYSDMTGIVARTMTTQIGTWTIVLDSKGDATAWDKLLWTGNTPQGTSMKVRVRSSKDNAVWSVWEEPLVATSLKTTPAGRYLQVETTLQVVSGDVSPVLYDLMIKTK